MLGFAASSALRAAFGALILAGFAALVWGIEGGTQAPGEPPPAVTPSVSSSHPLSVRIESTYPVATWSVSRVGAAQTAQASDATSWRGTVDAASGDELLVVARAAAAAEGNRCLRLTVGDAQPQVVWGTGDLTVTVAIP